MEKMVGNLILNKFEEKIFYRGLPGDFEENLFRLEFVRIDQIKTYPTILEEAKKLKVHRASLLKLYIKKYDEEILINNQAFKDSFLSFIKIDDYKLDSRNIEEENLNKFERELLPTKKHEFFLLKLIKEDPKIVNDFFSTLRIILLSKEINEKDFNFLFNWLSIDFQKYFFHDKKIKDRLTWQNLEFLESWVIRDKLILFKKNFFKFKTYTLIADNEKFHLPKEVNYYMKQYIQIENKKNKEEFLGFIKAKIKTKTEKSIKELLEIEIKNIKEIIRHVASEEYEEEKNIFEKLLLDKNLS